MSSTESLIDPYHEFTLVDIDWLIDPYRAGEYRAYKDRYWVAKDNKVLFYTNKKFPYAYPQCNQYKALVDFRLKKLPGARALFLPWAFVPYHDMP